MGLRGALPLTAAEHAIRGNTRPPKRLPDKLLKDVRGIYRRMKKLGDYYGRIAEDEARDKSKRPSPALWAALKCWKEALQAAYRIGGLHEPELERERDPHDELAARRASRRGDTVRA